MKEWFAGKRPLFVHDLTFSPKLTILVLAPHPDDFDVIGCTMKFFQKPGANIYVAVLTSGVSGVEDTFCEPPTRERKAHIRETEQRNSCKFFGLPDTNLSFLRLQEDEKSHPLDNFENLERVRDFILEKRPELIFLPHGNDPNLAHQRTYSFFNRIAAGLDFPVTALLNLDPKTIDMRYDLFTIFNEEEAAWKAELLRFHRSQHQRNLNERGYGIDERILKINRRVAQESPKPAAYAEVFELEHWSEGIASC